MKLLNIYTNTWPRVKGPYIFAIAINVVLSDGETKPGEPQAST